jgi:hypothetical protein
VSDERDIRELADDLFNQLRQDGRLLGTNERALLQNIIFNAENTIGGAERTVAGVVQDIIVSIISTIVDGTFGLSPEPDPPDPEPKPPRMELGPGSEPGGRVRIVDIAQFVSQEILAGLIDFVNAQEASFQQTGMPGVSVLPSLGATGTGILARILAVMPQVFSKLGLQSFNISRIETAVAAIGNGGRLELAARGGGVIYAFTFFSRANSFSGGHLIVENPANRDLWTIIEPNRNQVIFFPSDFDLEVRRVQSRSRQFRDRLFVLHGRIT